MHYTTVPTGMIRLHRDTPSVMLRRFVCDTLSHVLSAPTAYGHVLETTVTRVIKLLFLDDVITQARLADSSKMDTLERAVSAVFGSVSGPEDGLLARPGQLLCVEAPLDSFRRSIRG